MREEEFPAYIEDIEAQARRAWTTYGMLIVPGAEVSQNRLSGRKNSHIIALDIKRYVSADQPADLVDVWEAANRDDRFSVTSLKHFPYVANSDFHEPKHLYSWKTLGCLTVQPRDVDAGTTMDQQSPLPDISSERFAEALRRAQAEFREMPGLKLTEAQAARLLSFDSALCSAVLTTLVDRHFLMRTRNTFQRA